MRYLYKITNKINGKCYIGQTAFLKERFRQHCFNTSHCFNVHKAIEKYGRDAFEFVALAECSDDTIDAMEAAAILYFNSLAPNGYNLETGGCNGKYIHPETKRKMSEAAKKRITPEIRKKMSERRIGHKMPREAVQKMILSKTGKPGKPMSEEMKIKMSELHRGKIISEETRLRLSLSHKNPRPYQKGKAISEEAKRRISESLKKYFKNPENKEKLARSVMKKVYCVETDQTFESVKSAALFISAHAANLARAIKSNGKFRKKHWHYIDTH